MKNNLKRLSLLLAALTVSSAFASTVSAAAVFKNEDTAAKNYCSVCGAVFNHDCGTAAADKTSNTKTDDRTVYTDETLPYKNGQIFAPSNSNKNPVLLNPSAKPSAKPSTKPVIDSLFGCNLIGGKYISPEEAEKLLKEYFEDNNYDLYFYEGESQTLCGGAYYYSTDTDVAYYNYKTGKLVANGQGCATVYVYTAGGIPFFRFDVTVYRKNPSVKPVTLNLVADDWNISVDESTSFTVTASNGKTYDDIIFSIGCGDDIARITQISGKLTAEANGAVVVRAYSKSNPDISGEALVYIGNIVGAVADGSWNKYEGGINIGSWKDDICDFDFSWKNINGWIKSADGILIPVIKFEEATVDKGGEKVETTIITGGKYSLADLIKEAYGDKDKITALITKYNLMKYGIYTEKDCYSYLDCYFKGEDYIHCNDFGVADPSDVLSEIIKGILG